LQVVKTTEKEAAIYRTNDGVLCDWHREGEYQAKVVENKNVRRAKGGIYSAKDEEWERQLAEEMKVHIRLSVILNCNFFDTPFISIVLILCIYV
jgi:hypothetical protein